MTTDLVVADESRTDKTICLAVSPSLKAKGVKNRCRLYEIPLKLREKTIIAPPRMQKYIDYAAEIYGVYLEYISKEDIFTYSIDEMFLDITSYLKLYSKTPREMAKFLMDEIEKRVGVRATAGIGTNLYLSKIALDILAKHADDFIGELDEESFREKLWDHRPLTDFWRIGPGMARRLEKHTLYTMRAIAHADEDILYDLFGIDAELLIDHAWGREPVTIKDIKKYRSKSKSFSSGQVLHRDYTKSEASLVVREMMRELIFRMVYEKKKTKSVTMMIAYSNKYNQKLDGSSDRAVDISRGFKTLTTSGTAKMPRVTNDESVILPELMALYQEIVDDDLLIRRVYLNANNIQSDSKSGQLELFDEEDSKPRQATSAILDIQKRYGKNAIFRGEDLESHATTRMRYAQIGGHAANLEEKKDPPLIAKQKARRKNAKK